MLLPALSKAREKARAISCTSNLKQRGIALMMYAQENEGFIALERCLYAEGWSWAHETAVPTYPSITDTNKSLDKSYQCPAAKSHELSVYRVYGAFKYSLGSTFEKKSRLALVLVNP